MTKNEMNKQPVDIVSVKMTQYLIEDFCEELAELPPEEINKYLEQFEKENFRNYLQKEIFTLLEKKK